MKSGPFAVLLIIFALQAVFQTLGMVECAQADFACDSQVDACRSARDGHLMMCACKDRAFGGMDMRTAAFIGKDPTSGPELSGADLSHTNFAGSSVLRGADLSGANLHEAHLEGAVLFGVKGFDTVDVSGATFDAHTILPIDTQLKTEEFGTRTQYRRAGCERGMIWNDHDEAGLPENCDGQVTGWVQEKKQQQRSNTDSVFSTKYFEEAPSRAEPSSSDGNSGAAIQGQ